MNKSFFNCSILGLGAVISLSFLMTNCTQDTIANPTEENLIYQQVTGRSEEDVVIGNCDDPILLLIDEESIDNGNEPNNFSDEDVNDNISAIGQRAQLRYFKENVGKTIELFTGKLGDEGWYAPKTIPENWSVSGNEARGIFNYLLPAPGLGGGEDDQEVLLDKVPDVVPLRATGLKMLEGKTVFAVVYDSDISINYDPLDGNLQGDNLGVVAFRVLQVTARTDDSDALPKVLLSIVDTEEFLEANFQLFTNAPEPESSSEPKDTVPPVERISIPCEPTNDL